MIAPAYRVRPEYGVVAVSRCTACDQPAYLVDGGPKGRDQWFHDYYPAGHDVVTSNRRAEEGGASKRQPPS